MLKIVKHLVMLQMIFGSTLVLANTYHFAQTNPNNNNLVADPLGDQFTLDVIAGSGSNILFTFTNPVGITSSITGVYFGDEGSTLFSNIFISSESAGVAFSEGATPPNFPTNYTFTEVETAESDGTGQSQRTNNGINAAGESLVFTGVLKSGNTFDTVISSILSRDLKFGLLIKADNSAADKYLNTVPSPNAVPLPAAGWLFGSALFGLMGLSRRMH